MMMMADLQVPGAQKRVPEGVSSDGGQWFAERKDEQGMKLYDRSTGTCFNPPLSSTAEHALAFWENVEIPDITIERAKNLYNEQQRIEFASHLQSVITEYMVQWETKNARPKIGEGRQDRWEQARSDEEQNFTSAAAESESESFFHEENPERIKASEAQQIVRAWFAFRKGPNRVRFPDEEAKLNAHEVELRDGSETIITLVKRYRLNRFASQLEKVPDPTTDAIHQMQDALAGILNGMSFDVARTAGAVERQEM